jgi:hypothetical protein
MRTGLLGYCCAPAGIAGAASATHSNTSDECRVLGAEWLSFFTGCLRAEIAVISLSSI